jgi:hypothetical protein
VIINNFSTRQTTFFKGQKALFEGQSTFTRQNARYGIAIFVKWKRKIWKKIAQLWDFFGCVAASK